MSFCHYQCKEEIVRIARQQGFHATGVAEASPVETLYADLRDRWLSQGLNGSLEYMNRYSELRNDPRELLTGCNSVIVMAAPYYTPDADSGTNATFARYALGDDYHEVLRRLATPIAELLCSHGFESRICIDTAPVAERYWAVKSGVGFIGRNGLLIVPDAGSYFFLCTILTTAQLPPDAPCTLSCAGCDRCVRSCPAGAILPGQLIDARRCLSCLTIELRGELPEWVRLGNRVFGCDTCQSVCPHNRQPLPTTITQFAPRPALKQLTAEKIMAMTQTEFSTIFRHSAVKRAKLAGLQRNAARILSKMD